MKASRCRISFNATIAIACLLCFAAQPFALAQAGSDTVLGPGGSSPNSTTTQSNPAKIVVATTMSTEYGTGSVFDKIVTHLGRLQDRLTFVVANRTKNTVDYEFSSGDQVDFEIDDSTGKEIWLYSKSRVFPTSMSRLTLKPGKSSSYSVQWSRRDDNDTPVPPGVYTVLATLQAMPRFVVTGTSVMDVHHDQDNPTRLAQPLRPGYSDAPDSSGGTVEQTDVTPPVQAKTTIVVAATMN